MTCGITTGRGASLTTIDSRDLPSTSNAAGPGATVLAAALLALASAAAPAQPGPASAAARPQGSRIPLPIDACSLLTAQEIAQVIGLPVEEGRREDAGLTREGSWSSTCLWRVHLRNPAPPDPRKPLGGASFVILNALRWPPGRAGEFLQAFRDAARRGDIPRQPSPRKFGDEALWWGDGLAVRRGDVSVGISVFTPGTGGPRTSAREEKLAPLVVQRLDRRP